MIWNKARLRLGIQNIPNKLFNKKNVCPVCEKKIESLKKERFKATKGNPYMKYFDKYYYVHKECFYLMFEGMNETIQDNISEYTAYAI